MKLCLFQLQIRSASPPYFSATFEGTSGEFTIPYSGRYKLTLSGAQGGCYGGEGGRGITLSKTLWLKEGVTVKYETYDSPGTYECPDGGDVLTVHGGKSSRVYFDGVLQVKVGGGQGVIGNKIAPSGVNKVYLYGGDDVVRKDNVVHFHAPNGCYKVEDRSIECECRGGFVNNTHDPADGKHWVRCISHKHTCNICGRVSHRSNPSCYHFHWSCYLEDGQIVPMEPAPVATSTGDLQDLGQTRVGAGQFTIQLVEQNRLDYVDTNVKSPMYQNVPLHLVVMEYLDGEHYVAYCKHGN